MRPFRRACLFVSSAAVLLLAACSDGAAPSDPDARAASAAALSARSDLDTHAGRLAWHDSFPDGSTYRVQQRGPDGSFTTVEVLPSAGGRGAVLSWQRPLTVSTDYRVQAVRPDHEVTLLTASGAGTVTVSVPETLPQIVLDAQEPVGDTVQLALDAATAFPAVAWSVDGHDLGAGASAPGNGIAWDTRAAPNGPHLVLAQVQVTPDSVLSLTRTVAVTNSRFVVQADVRGTTGTIAVDVRASAVAGIARVEATFDGAPLAALTAPNACSPKWSDECDLYEFTVDGGVAGTGAHAMLVTATDGTGATRTLQVDVPIENAPVLTVASPIDGALVFGSLVVDGSASSDVSAAVDVTVHLGDLLLLQASGPSFHADQDLSGVPAGPHTLTVRAVDADGRTTLVQRTITVASSPGGAVPPLFSMGASTWLRAVENGRLLYQATDGSLHVRDASTQVDLPLDGSATLGGATGWLGAQLGAGRAYVAGQGSDCDAAGCIYQWLEDGQRRNLTSLGGAPSGVSDQNPRVVGTHVVWYRLSGGTPGYVLYDATTDRFQSIAAPAGSDLAGNFQYDLATVDGVLHFYFWARVGTAYQVFDWRADTLAATPLTSGDGIQHVYPRGDGQRLAWLEKPVGDLGDLAVLRWAAPDGSDAVALSAIATRFLLRDGVVAWVERTDTASPVQAAGPGGITLLSDAPGATLHDTAAGRVVYGDQGRLYAWDAHTGVRTLLLDSAPVQAVLDGDQLYFVLGGDGTVYRLSLAP